MAAAQTFHKEKLWGIPVGVSMGSLNSLAYWTDAVGAFTHGSSAIRMIRAQASGMPVCLTVTRHDAGFGMFGLTPLSQLSMRHGLRPSDGRDRPSGQA